MNRVAGVLRPLWTTGHVPPTVVADSVLFYMRRSTNRLRWAMMFQLLEVRQIHSFQGTTLYSCKHGDTLKIDAWKMKFPPGHSWSPFSGAVWYVSFRVFGPLGCHCVSFPEVRSFFRSWSCHWYFLMEKIMDHLGRTVKRSLYSNSMYYNCFFFWTYEPSTVCIFVPCCWEVPSPSEFLL